MRCLHWYDAWLTHQSEKPRAPVFNLGAYTTTSQVQREYAAFARSLENHRKDLGEWESNDRATVKQCVTAFSELLQLEGGWMTPAPATAQPSVGVAAHVSASSSPSATDADLSSLRLSLIPRLTFMLLQIARESHQEDVALGVADLVAAPMHNLQACFTTEQKRALLVQFREAYIRLHLKNDRDEDEDQRTHA